MTREQYLEKRNDKRGVDGNLIYSFYALVCNEKGLTVAPMQVFIQAIQIHPSGDKIVQQAFEYYDTKFGIIEMSIMKNGKREVIKYI